jgi:hypothetical protein
MPYLVEMTMQTNHVLLVARLIVTGRKGESLVVAGSSDSLHGLAPLIT